MIERRNMGLKMISYGLFLILAINGCIITAQPTTIPTLSQTETEQPHLKHRGHYSSHSAPLNCSACEDVVDLIVCGTDGRTYINECRFKCAKLNDTNLDIKHSSVCEKDREGCSCTDDTHSKICGTDGQTYDTKCLMWCENWVNGYGSTVQVSYDGPCKDQSNLTDGNKPAHYKDTETKYNYASDRYNDAATRYDEAATLFNTAACSYLEKAAHFSDAKTRHNYPKTRDDANQNIHEAIHFIDEATRYIDEATRHIAEATKRIDAATQHIDEFTR